MEENKIPAVSEFTKSKDPGFLYGVNGYGIGQKFEDLMIEFAKMHVKAQQNAILEANKPHQENWEAINDNVIIDAYPLDNIK